MPTEAQAGITVIGRNDPLLPKLADLQQETNPRVYHRTEELQELETRLDGYADKLGRSPDPLPVLDFKFHPGLTIKLDLGRASVRWPSGLFIPGDADYHEYWFLPPPQGGNRYSREWVFGNGSDANHAYSATGELFAYASPRPIDSSLRSEAGVGFVFRPPFTLATYAVEVTVDLLGQDRYDVNTNAPAGGKVREFGGLYTVAWEISPIDGSLSLVEPFGFASLFDQTFENLSGFPINEFRRTGPVRTNMVLEGNKVYLIGVVAAVQIDNAWIMDNGSPMQPLPAGSTWKVWCAITGTVPQVWITPSVVTIP
jgi:hypothetical protein